jgi:tetratricopeptide (TPR) repeat protein
MKKIVIILLTAVIFTSCNKFLDYQPDDRTDLNSEVKIKELVASAYPKAHYVAFAESMSDNAGDKATTDRIEQNFVPWRFEDQVKSEYDMPNTYWQACYAAIAAANHALEAIEELGNPESLNPTKGEALVARAYSHFMLALFFAKPYGPTSSSDLGIPYVTEPEKIAQPQYSRGTVASVYTNIEQDLLTGIALIDNSSYSRPSFHFNRNAAYAFATRFFLFKKEYEKVIQYADLVAKTDVISGTLRPWNTDYVNWSYYVIQDAYGNSTTPANLLLVEANSIWGGDYPAYNYGLNSSLLAEVYGSTSNPLGITLSFRSKVFGGTEVVYNIPKFKTSMIKESISDNFGEPWVVYSLFAIEEVLFNRAEAYANVGRVDDAINELNVFLSKRITGYNASNANHRLTAQKLNSFYPSLSEKDAAIEASLNFKRQEFLFEGMRWLDIIRTGKTVTHTSVRGSGENYNIIVDANDNKRVLQLPQEAIQSGLEANPR